MPGRAAARPGSCASAWPGPGRGGGLEGRAPPAAGKEGDDGPASESPASRRGERRQLRSLKFAVASRVRVLSLVPAHASPAESESFMISLSYILSNTGKESLHWPAPESLASRCAPHQDGPARLGRRGGHWKTRFSAPSSPMQRGQGPAGSRGACPRRPPPQCSRADESTWSSAPASSPGPLHGPLGLRRRALDRGCLLDRGRVARLVGRKARSPAQSRFHLRLRHEGNLNMHVLCKAAEQVARGTGSAVPPAVAAAMQLRAAKKNTSSS